MQIQTNPKQIINKNKSFSGGGFYNATAELETNVIMSRALIDLAGCDVPWVIMANNKQERIERARRYSIVFVLAFLTPVALLPVLNRSAMKNFVGLTEKFWSNNHMAMHIPNEFLVSAEKTKEHLKDFVPTMGPIEKVYCKLTNKKTAEQKLDLKDLLIKAGAIDDDYEPLRKKIINAKNWVLFADLLSSGVALGMLGFVNNYLTKKKTGQAGFSAELKMADKSVIEKRADNYEKNKNKRYATFAALALAVSTIPPLLLKHGLTSPAKNGLSKLVKDHAPLMDYKSGIYMSRIAFFMLMVINHGGLLLASRNKTEAKDTMIRMGTGDAIFFGGDILLGSVFANISDRLFKTELRKKEQTSIFSKIFPKTESIKEINNLVDSGKMELRNKKFATGLYWLNLGVLSFCMGYVIPTLINKIIKKDVQKDVEKEYKDISEISPKVYLGLANKNKFLGQTT